MLPFEDRYTRQRQLREVGLSGQHRLEASVKALGRGASDDVAADYLARAGVQVVRKDDLPSDASVSGGALCAFSGPRDYLTGALVALEHVRAVLSAADTVSLSKPHDEASLP